MEAPVPRAALSWHDPGPIPEALQLGNGWWKPWRSRFPTSLPRYGTLLTQSSDTGDGNSCCCCCNGDGGGRVGTTKNPYNHHTHTRSSTTAVPRLTLPHSTAWSMQDDPVLPSCRGPPFRWPGTEHRTNVSPLCVGAPDTRGWGTRVACAAA